MTYSRFLSSKYPKRMRVLFQFGGSPVGSSEDGRRPIVLLAGELEVVDVDVVVGAGDVHLELDPIDLRRRDVGLVRISPVGQLLHALERDDVLLPLGRQVQVRAEVVEAFGAHRAVRVGVHVWHLEPHLPGRALRPLRPEGDPGVPVSYTHLTLPTIYSV